MVFKIITIPTERKKIMERYNLNEYNRKKQMFRFGLGIGQMVSKPLLSVFFLLPIVSAFLLDYIEKRFLTVFSVAEILKPIFSFCLTFVTVVLPIALTIYILQTIGEITAKKYEAKICMCFDKKQLENGNPVIVSKKQDKNAITVEWFSYIPKHIWEERQNYIADIFNIRIVNISYGKKANRIILSAIKGKRSNSKGVIYDETI